MNPVGSSCKRKDSCNKILRDKRGAFLCCNGTNSQIYIFYHESPGNQLVTPLTALYNMDARYMLARAASWREDDHKMSKKPPPLRAKEISSHTLYHSANNIVVPKVSGICGGGNG